MTSLEAIAFTFAGGSAVFLSSLTFFGIAVSRRSVFIAPRCTARPRDAIYNPNPKDPSQDRGSPMLGWIPWCLSLSYDEMLRGVPGTGTRRGGLGGSMLGCNLDAIVLLRFHALCLRITILASLLCVVIILPLNLTARCHKDVYSIDCQSEEYQSMTNYERTTLAHIPPLAVSESTTGSGVRGFFGANGTIWGRTYDQILWRLYGIVICSLIITIYSCRLLKQEWIDALALRRVYYLEGDHYNRRKHELDETVLCHDDSDDDGDEGGDDHSSLERRRAKNRFKPSNRRDPWIPHPEQRDTVPNVELYSVLVGGLPALPSEVVDEEDIEAAVGFSRRQSIDWQLAVATTFFDHCVPNQPGFSSSIAAVTILPDAPELAKAWRKWYTAAAALRRLRFIRRLIADMRYYEISEDGDEDDEDEDEWDEEMEPVKPPQIDKQTTEPYDEYDEHEDEWDDNEEVGVAVLADSFKPQRQRSYSANDAFRANGRPPFDPSLSEATTEHQHNHSVDRAPPPPPPPPPSDSSASTDHQRERQQQFFQSQSADMTGITENLSRVEEMSPSFESSQKSDQSNPNSPTPADQHDDFASERFVPPNSKAVVDPYATKPGLHFSEDVPPPPPPPRPPHQPRHSQESAYHQNSISRQYYSDVFGTTSDEEVESLLYQALNFGPEQVAVYSREMAQSAATCCPNGMCGESRLKRARIDELIALEQDALAKVHEANVALQYAQAKAAVSVMDTAKPEMHLPEKCDEEDMRRHLEEEKKHKKASEHMHLTYHTELTVEETQPPLSDNTLQAAGSEADEMGMEITPSPPMSPSQPHHRPGASLEDIVLPDNLEMEAQLLARFHHRSPVMQKLHKTTTFETEGTGTTVGVTNTYAGDVPTHQRGKSGPPAPHPSADNAEEPTPTINNARKTLLVGEISEIIATTNNRGPVVNGVELTSSTRNLQTDHLDVDVDTTTTTTTMAGGGAAGATSALHTISENKSGLLTAQEEEEDQQSVHSVRTSPPRTNGATAAPVAASGGGAGDGVFVNRDESHPLHSNRARANSAHTTSNATIHNHHQGNTQPVGAPTPGSRSASSFRYGSYRSSRGSLRAGSHTASMIGLTAQGKFRLSTRDLLQDGSGDLTPQPSQPSTPLRPRHASFDFDQKGDARGGGTGMDEYGRGAASPENTGFDMPRNYSQQYQPYNSHGAGDGLEPYTTQLKGGDNQSVNACANSTLTPGMMTGPSRRRLNTESTMGRETHLSEQWAQVERIIADGDAREQKYFRRTAFTGVWTMPSPKHLWESFVEFMVAFSKWATEKTTDVVDDLARESTYAVVTFTSRQAAVAARNCLADGRGAKRWLAHRTVPVPPLADAAPCDLKTCRGCCRPVTLSINDKQKMLRKYFAWALLATIYVFYTFPITAAAGLVSPERLTELFPKLEDRMNDSVFFSQLVSGLVPALLFTTFFALCPLLFKAIANFGSNGLSVYNAEYYALHYYWWFMVVTAFSGSSLLTMTLNAFNEGQLGSEAAKVLTTIATTVPTQTAAAWINWIIVRTTMTLPLQYMLQINSFIFTLLGWNCCARCVMGGGPGGPPPYRIYIDSGTVFLCVVSLAPASPIVAPCALIYFLYCTPLWRRNLIFMYRPKFDAGGLRWPFLFDVCISSMIVGQILLTTMMALKEAVGPAILAATPILPTIIFRKRTRKRFLQAYLDAGLLQTSLLDGWDNSVPMSPERREEYRKFLVDAHKAAYIPVCIASSFTSILTAEPAVVVHSPDDDERAFEQAAHSSNDSAAFGGQSSPATPAYRNQASIQHGASLRRVGQWQHSMSLYTDEGQNLIHDGEDSSMSTYADRTYADATRRQQQQQQSHNGQSCSPS